MSSVGVEQNNGSRIEVMQMWSELSACPFKQDFLYLLLRTKGSLLPFCKTSRCSRTFLVITTIRDKNALWNTDSLKISFFLSVTYVGYYTTAYLFNRYVFPPTYGSSSGCVNTLTAYIKREINCKERINKCKGIQEVLGRSNRLVSLHTTLTA
jgi:hypothetical protein